MSDPIDTLPVWVINLDKSPDRMARMDEGLRAQGLTYKRIPGIDGRAELYRLLPKVDRVAYERNMGQELLPGKVGCYFSHLSAWQRLIESGQEMALILEDDVVFHADFRDALALAIRAKAHWDLLRLNRIRAKLPVSQGRIGPYLLNAYIGPCTGNGAYLIRRETARLLLGAMVPQTRAADHEINRFFVHGFRLRGLEPFPSHVEDFGDSQITGRNHAEVKKPAALLRLPHYGLKATNYLRRLWWLWRHGELRPKDRALV
tara:strand:+ start:457 stop:1236 length:780 start_codon:yes stop_codon:yes gene_type:complete